MDVGATVTNKGGDTGTVSWVSQGHDGSVIAAGVWWANGRFSMEFGDDIQETETVPDGWACPGCGENRMDRLTNRDGRITCSCGREYNIE